MGSKFINGAVPPNENIGSYSVDSQKRVKLENGNVTSARKIKIEDLTIPDHWCSTQVKVCKNGYWQSANIPGKKATAVTSSTDGTKIVAVAGNEVWVYGCYDYYGACDAPGSTCSASSSSSSGGSSGGYYHDYGYSGSGYGR